MLLVKKQKSLCGHTRGRQRSSHALHLLPLPRWAHVNPSLGPVLIRAVVSPMDQQAVYEFPVVCAIVIVHQRWEK